MPHMIETITDVSRMTDKYLCNFSESDIKQAGKDCYVEWIGSSFSDPGDDWNLFQLKDRFGRLIAERRTNGY